MKRVLLVLSSMACVAAAGAAPPEAAKTVEVPGAVAPVSTATATATVAPTQSSRSAKSSKPAQGKAIDRVELDQTTITGNRELPNVMVIVPWKESSPGSVSPASRSLLEDALAPLDREEFRRELQYREALQPTSSPSPTTPPN